MTAATLVLSETFLTVQGEGPSAGRRATFIRLGGCNLRCNFCDTAYTWDASLYDLRAEMTRTSVDEILDQVRRNGTGLTVITGGEPLLHQTQPGWDQLLTGLPGDVEIETNGTVAPTARTAGRCRFVVSPKLAHSGDPLAARIRPEALHALAATGRAVFKFVVLDVGDLDAVDAIARQVGVPAGDVWIMPEGTTAATVLRRSRLIVDDTVARGWNFSSRLHVLLWGSERGH